MVGLKESQLYQELTAEESIWTVLRGKEQSQVERELLQSAESLQNECVFTRSSAAGEEEQEENRLQDARAP